MSVFDWVNELEDRLVEAGEDGIANAIRNLPYCANNNDFDAVESMVPMLVGYAREKELPWLEVYARHWRLQAYVTSATKVEEMLPEAVSLIALTAGDDVRDCPQSRCAVQDLSLCFGAVDAPGFAAERLQAVKQVADSLEPGADCSACMMSEMVAALNALGRHRDAYQHGVDWMDRARETGAFDFTNPFFWTDQAQDLFNAALGAGAFDEARKILKQAKPDRDETRDWKALARARLAVAAGDTAAALKVFPSQARVKKSMWLRRPWLATAVALVQAGALANDTRLSATATLVFRRCEANGQLRDAFDAAIDAATLAILRKRWGAAQLRLMDAECLRPRLRGDHGADARLAELRRRLASLSRECASDANDAEAALDSSLVANNAIHVASVLVELREDANRAEPLLSAYRA